ncbi:MAG: hypothetical protein QOC95_2147 [Thermoleophilaceae bacterium]|jgi:hypothetical protein|nr:hypothetical protein [Thermoleophilaceae bacterium]
MPRSFRLLVLAAFLLLLPAQTAAASVVWTAAAERPLLEEWANFSCADSSRINRVESPSAQGRYAYRVDLHDGDDSFGERCEMAMGSPTRAGFPVFAPGDENWIAYQVYLPSGFPSDGDKYNEITQFKQVNDLCAPALSLHVEQGKLQLFHSADNRGSCGGRSVWAAPVAYGRWIKLLFHIGWSSDPSTGFVEVFGDIDGGGLAQLMPRTPMFTMKMDSQGRTMPVDARLGIYRDSAISGDATAYFDGFTIATDRASAEQGAFGAVAEPGPPTVTGASDGGALAPGPAAPVQASGSTVAPPHMCRVPRVTRHRLRAAAVMLRRAGCSAGAVKRRPASNRYRGRVVRQSVPAGRLVPVRTAVRLTVGRRR